MLPSDLLISRYEGNSIVPKKVNLSSDSLQKAQRLIDCFTRLQGQTRAELTQQLQELEGDQTDYRLQRGLAHLLNQSFSTFETVSPLDPSELRLLVFAEAAKAPASHKNTQDTLSTVALTLSTKLDQDITPADIEKGLYADRKDNQILIAFEAPAPEALLHRYNLSQVQGLFYRASRVVIQAYRNDPGEYKLLFRYIKLFRLMACLLYTSPSPRDLSTSRMPSSA